CDRSVSNDTRASAFACEAAILLSARVARRTSRKSGGVASIDGALGLQVAGMEHAPCGSGRAAAASPRCRTTPARLVRSDGGALHQGRRRGPGCRSLQVYPAELPDDGAGFREPLAIASDPAEQARGGRGVEPGEI